MLLNINKTIITKWIVPIGMLYLLGCASHKEYNKFRTNDLLRKEQKIWYSVSKTRHPDSANTVSYNCMPYLLDTSKFKRFDTFAKSITLSVLENKIPAYDPFYYDINDIYRNKVCLQMSMEAINARLDVLPDTTNIYNSDGTYSYVVYKPPIDYKELKTITFNENWYFNFDDLSFNKIVIDYCMVRRWKKHDNGYVYDKVFYLLPHKQINKNSDFKASEKRMEYVGTMKYNLQLNFTECAYTNAYTDNKDLCILSEHLENRRAPQLTNNLLIEIIEKLLRKAINGDIPVYDYTKQNKKLNTKQIRKSCGCQQDTISLQTKDGSYRDTIIKNDPIASGYKSIIFEEDLYIDWKTLRLKKEVRAISPVRYYWKNDKEGMIKKIVFTIRLS